MQRSDRIMRGIAFYLSVILFFISVPIVLSYSLGYKIDYHDLKIYKTGILYINSRPSGASIYINDKRHADLTPAQIEELKPGPYKVEVRREGFYPWEKDLVVRPNMVTRADRIVLFPIMQDMKKIGFLETVDFTSNKNNIYYLTRNGLFRSNIDGTSLARLSLYSNWPAEIINKKFSADGNKFLYFTDKSVYIVYLNLEEDLSEEGVSARVEEVLKTDDPVIDVFWYSGANYVIAVTAKDIRVVELLGGGVRNIVSLYKFNSRPKSVYYDRDKDSLYFIDSKKESSPKDEKCLYRLDLRQQFFDSLIKLLLKRETDTAYEKRRSL